MTVAVAYSLLVGLRAGIVVACHGTAGFHPVNHPKTRGLFPMDLVPKGLVPGLVDFQGPAPMTVYNCQVDLRPVAPAD
jgi:hypothetical protein